MIAYLKFYYYVTFIAAHTRKIRPYVVDKKTKQMSGTWSTAQNSIAQKHCSTQFFNCPTQFFNCSTPFKQMSNRVFQFICRTRKKCQLLDSVNQLSLFFVNCSNPIEPGLTRFKQLKIFVLSSWFPAKSVDQLIVEQSNFEQLIATLN